MIAISDMDIIGQHELIEDAFVHNRVGVFTEESFIQKSFPVLENRVGRSYPYKVRIPKSLKEMNEGDFKPACEIVVEKPFPGPYSNIWFGDATKGIQLICGYRNGDSRYINDVTLGDDVIHGVMAGSTGQGKSVTLNSIIYGACLLYPPWELRLTLSDAKIVEFKTLAQSNPMPHIDIIAATADVDYLISVLKTKCDEMKLCNSVFTRATEVFGKDAKKLADFREVTGLCLPQNFLIFDEFQTMISNAGKQASNVIQYLQDFAKLGRNTGYHLFLTSQELGNDLPEAVTANITCRAALGCYPNISEMILGNDAAGDILGKKGHLIFNLKSQQRDRNDNVLIRVPFIQHESHVISEVTMKTYADLNQTNVMRFYDETRVVHENDYPKFLSRFPADWHTIYLGEPSYIMDDPDQCTKITFSAEDRESVLVLSATNGNLIRMFKMLKMNVMRCGGITHFVLCANSSYEKDAAAGELSSRFFLKEGDYETSTIFNIARSVLYRRYLAFLADERVFASQQVSENTDKLFYSIYEKGSEKDTMLNRSRFYYIQSLLLTDPIVKTGLQVSQDQILKTVENTIELYGAYGAGTTRLTWEKIPPIFVWILGLDRILGLGRDNRPRYVESFKKLMLDANKANMRFLVFTNTMMDLTDLVTGFKWFLMDAPMQGDIQKCKLADDYPNSVSSVLEVLFDADNRNAGCLKFKKMFFDGEMP